MDSTQIKELCAQVERALNDAAASRQRVEFLSRVLTQAVLTHGGELRVDPALAETARAETRLLEFGSGGVRLVEGSSLTRLSRGRALDGVEAATYMKVREQVEEEFPPDKELFAIGTPTDTGELCLWWGPWDNLQSTLKVAAQDSDLLVRLYQDKPARPLFTRQGDNWVSLPHIWQYDRWVPA